MTILWMGVVNESYVTWLATKMKWQVCLQVTHEPVMRPTVDFFVIKFPRMPVENTLVALLNNLNCIDLLVKEECHYQIVSVNM